MKLKFTPFLLCAIVLVILSVSRFHLFDFWILRGGESLIGIYALGSVLGALVTFTLDRYFINTFNNTGKVWIIEMIILAVLALSHSYYTRRIQCEVGGDVDYFGIVYNVESAPKLDYSFPFDKKLRIEVDTVIFTSTLDEFKGLPDIHGRTYNNLSSSANFLNVGGRRYEYQIITFDSMAESRPTLTQQQKDSIVEGIKQKLEKE